MPSPSPPNLPPCLVLICGLPGTGKTTLAMALADRLGAVHLNTDTMREDLGERGHYSAEAKRRVYTRLLAEALVQGRKGAVVVDGTFSRADRRQEWMQAAVREGLSVFWIEVRAAECTARERVRHTRPDSEADEAVYEHIRREWEPLEVHHLVLDASSEPADPLADRALAWLRSQAISGS